MPVVQLHSCSWPDVLLNFLHALQRWQQVDIITCGHGLVLVPSPILLALKPPMRHTAICYMLYMSEDDARTSVDST